MGCSWWQSDCSVSDKDTGGGKNGQVKGWNEFSFSQVSEMSWRRLLMWGILQRYVHFWKAQGIGTGNCYWLFIFSEEPVHSLGRSSNELGVISHISPPALGKWRAACAWHIVSSPLDCPDAQWWTIITTKIKTNQQHHIFLCQAGPLHAIHLLLHLSLLPFFLINVLLFTTCELNITYFFPNCQIFKLSFIHLKTMLCFSFYVHQPCNKVCDTRAHSAFISSYISSVAVKSPLPFFPSLSPLWTTHLSKGKWRVALSSE